MDAQDQNTEKMAALGRMTRAMIHDFNNSLASIMGHADFLVADLPEGSEQHVFAENIKRAALQLQSSIDEIRKFSAPDAQSIQKIEASPSPASPLSILLVEDREMVMRTIETMLRRDHHRVEAVADGFTALDIIRENPRKYDLLITDYTMPHLNGKDLLDDIRQDFKAMPVIIMSGDATSLNDLKADKKNKNIVVLPKPITAHDLANAIKSIQTPAK